MQQKLTVYQSGGAFPDPHLWIEGRSQLNIRFAAFEGLVGYDDHLNIIPLLAESWSVSDDAREWNFTIRKNVYFHDGTLLSVSDVISSLQKASQYGIQGKYGTDSLLYSYLGQARIEAADESHLWIRLPEPMADLPDLLVYIMIIPESSSGSDPKMIPGTGAFILSEIDKNRYIFRRNDHYWGRKSEISELIFVDEKNAEQRAAALLEEAADIAADLDWSQTTIIDGDDDCLIIEYQMPAAISVMLNCFKGPFTDVKIRQALNYGTDVDEIIQNACGGTAVKLTGPLTRYHFGYDQHAAPYPYDTAEAWRLLAEAGYADGAEFSIYCPSKMPDEAEAVVRCLKKQWARIGIKLNIVMQRDREQYALDVKNKNICDMCVFDSAPLSTYRVFHEKLDSSVRGPWWQGYDNPSFNDLLNKASRTADPSEREKIYRESLRMVSEDAPWVFLYSPVKFFGMNWKTFDLYPFICQRADGLILPGRCRTEVYE